MSAKEVQANRFEQRRRQLGMPQAILAKKSGVSLPTVHRILSRGPDGAGYANVRAVAEALGMEVRFDDRIEVEKLRETQARQKAERLVKMVQGTSALEGQAVGREALQQMIRQTVHELLAGSRRKLWDE